MLSFSAERAVTRNYTGERLPPKTPARKGCAMPGPRPVLCTFPDDFLQVALDTVSRRTVAIQTVQRFSLVLLLHEQPSLGNEEEAEAVGLRSTGTTLAKSLGRR